MSNTFHFASAAVLVSLLSFFGGCSVLYDGQQSNALNACEKLDDWNQRVECKKRHQTSFDEYEKQRKDAMKKGAE